MTQELIDLKAAGQPARDLDLTDARLDGQELTGLRAEDVELRCADLRRATLVDVHWTGCRLRDARLDGADLSHAVLRMCDLGGVQAGGITARAARLENCRAEAITLDGADLGEASLCDTELNRASLRRTNLRGADLSGTSLRGADLSGADLRGANLEDADLRGADLRGANLEDADLRGADLRGAILDDARMDGTELYGAQRDEQAQVQGEAIAPMVAELYRNLGGTRTIDPSLIAALDQRLGTTQPLSRVRELQLTNTATAVVQALESLGIDTVMSAAMSLVDDDDEPSPAAQQLLRELGTRMGLGPNLDPEQLLAALRPQPRPPPSEDDHE